jgi:phosphate/sulfate permease
VGAWYTVGALLGFGLGLGVIASGLLAVSTRGMVAAMFVAAAVSLVFTIKFEPVHVIAAVVGAVVGAASASVVVRGALARGGTRLGVAGFMTVAGVVVFLLAAIPVVGYVETLALPLLAARMRGREPERHAGLRTLAK